MEISDEAVIVDSSRLKSVVWKDFDRIKNGDTCVAVCRHCKKKLSGSSTSGTSHLRNHLIRCRRRSNHDIAQLLSTRGKKKEGGTLAIASFSFDQDQRGGGGSAVVVPNNLVNATTTTTTSCKFEQGHPKDVAINIRNNHYFDHKRSRFDLARMIILHGYPLAMVEHVGFKIFVRNLQPLFEVVTLDGVEADCKEIYQNEKQKVCDLLDKLPGKISLSADMWVAAKGDARYLCLTAHCIDDTWQLKKKVLNFIMVEDDDPCSSSLRRTQDDISEVIMTCLREWDIDRKLFSMTFDTCSPTYDYAACRIRDLLSQNRFLLCNGQLFEVGCAANVIKLMAQDALEALTDVTHKIRESIRYITSSQATQRKFNDMVLQVVGSSSSSSSYQKCLCLDDPMRWNSTYVMLEIALEHKQAFSLLQQHDPLYPNTICPSDIDWDRASAVTSFLKLFVEVSNIFAGSSKQQHQHATANIYFPEICDIHLHLIEWCQNPDDYICSLASKMKSKFDEYWKKTSLALAIAAILDPRFKMKLVEYYYPQIYGENATECIDIVSNCMKELYNGHDIYSPLAAAAGGGSHCQVSNNNNDRLTGFDRFLHETSQSQNIKSDLDKYLEEPLFPRNVDFSILNWWKVHTPRYPILSMMARNILGIPMSKVGVDTGDRVVDHFRTSLSSDTLQALMCAHDWLWNSNGFEDSKSSSSPSTLALCYDAN